MYGREGRFERYERLEEIAADADALEEGSCLLHGGSDGKSCDVQIRSSLGISVDITPFIMFARNLARNVPRLQQLHQRSLHVSAPLRLQNLYENPETPPLSIKRLDSKGYLLSDGLLIPGGCVFADGRAFLWDVDPPVGDGSKGLNVAWDGWTPERFKVFEKIVPRPGE